jgi:hypothetical protein
MSSFGTHALRHGDRAKRLPLRGRPGVEPARAEYRSRRTADAFPQPNGDLLPSSASLDDRALCRPGLRTASWLPARSELRRLPAAFRCEAVHLAAFHLAIDLPVPRGRHFLGPESRKLVGHFLLISCAHHRERLPRQGPCLTLPGSRHAIPSTSSGRAIEYQPRHPVGSPCRDPGRPPATGADHHRP